MAKTTDFAVGDKVTFGRPNGEQTLGTVVKINGARVKVRQDEQRGKRPAGCLWNVHPSAMWKVEGAQAEDAPMAPLARTAAPPALPASGFKRAGEAFGTISAAFWFGSATRERFATNARVLAIAEALAAELTDIASRPTFSGEHKDAPTLQTG